jgi:hypothetical protein
MVMGCLSLLQSVAHLTQSWRSDMTNSPISPTIIALHFTPVAPLEHDGGRSGIDFEHLPSESRHGALETMCDWS